MVSRRNII